MNFMDEEGEDRGGMRNRSLSRLTALRTRATRPSFFRFNQNIRLSVEVSGVRSASRGFTSDGFLFSKLRNVPVLLLSLQATLRLLTSDERKLKDIKLSRRRFLGTAAIGAAAIGGTAIDGVRAHSQTRIGRNAWRHFRRRLGRRRRTSGGLQGGRVTDSIIVAVFSRRGHSRLRRSRRC